MLITPEKVRWFGSEVVHRMRWSRRDPPLWLSDVALTCDATLHARPGMAMDAERACLEIIDGWQATDQRDALSKAQLEDLEQTAGSADDRHAYLTCMHALTPHRHGWQPSRVEAMAVEQCRAAWNLRAARLRDAGIHPWPQVEDRGDSILLRMPTRSNYLGSLPGRTLSRLYVRLGALTKQWLSLIVEDDRGDIWEAHSRQVLLERLAHQGLGSPKIAQDAASSIWGGEP